MIPYVPDIVSARFLYEYFCAYKEPLFVSKMIGTANVSLTIGKIGEVPVPIISPTAQNCVYELMTLCDELEVAQAKREKRRDRLVAATLHGLNNGDENGEPGILPTFKENARFYFNHLPRLTTRPEHIRQLRQTILNLAVRGKLVEQNSEDEPASELLKRIREKRGRMRRHSGAEDCLIEITEAEPPFEIPESWEWVPSTEPSVVIPDKGKKVQTKDVLEFGKFPVVDQGKVFIRGYCNDAQKVIRIDEPIIVFGDHTRETKLIDFDFVVGADGVKLLKPIEVTPAYYFLALQWIPLESRGYGRHFKLLRASRIPLPPLAEQHRIVTKVNELMALCDELEAKLTSTAATRRQLLMLHCTKRLTSILEFSRSYHMPAKPKLKLMVASTVHHFENQSRQICAVLTGFGWQIICRGDKHSSEMTMAFP